MAIQGSMLPFREAEDYFAQKVNLPTLGHDDLRHGAHVRSFSVAGMTRDDMLTETRAMIERVRDGGLPFEEFRKSFGDMVRRTGWEFNAVGATEEARIDWRARIIWQTNMRTAYMAGRYRQMTDPDVLRMRPYWLYRHGDSQHPRKMHLAWNGLVLMATDPWWSVHYPPNGFGCSCEVEALNARQLAKLGKAGPDPTPGDQSYPGKDPRTGEPETRWPGIDRGWEYNVGQEWMSGVVPRELAEPLKPFGSPIAPRADLPPLPDPTPVDPARVMPDGLTDEDYVDSFLAEFGATRDRPAFWRDPSGGIVAIDRSLFEQRDMDGNALRWKVRKFGRERYVRLMADAMKQPDEIWADWAAGPDGQPVLRRNYLRRVSLDGKSVFVTFGWARRGWLGITAFDAKPAYIERQRRGALLYRRK